MNAGDREAPAWKVRVGRLAGKGVSDLEITREFVRLAGEGAPIPAKIVRSARKCVECVGTDDARYKNRLRSFWRELRQAGLVAEAWPDVRERARAIVRSLLPYLSTAPVGWAECYRAEYLTIDRKIDSLEGGQEREYLIERRDALIGYLYANRRDPACKRARTLLSQDLIERGKRVPRRLRPRAEEAGKGRPPNGLTPRDMMIGFAVDSTKGLVPHTRNRDSERHSICDAIADALTECGLKPNYRRGETPWYKTVEAAWGRYQEAKGDRWADDERKWLRFVIGAIGYFGTDNRELWEELVLRRRRGRRDHHS